MNAVMFGLGCAVGFASCLAVLVLVACSRNGY
jgi:hypothetical protein